MVRKPVSEPSSKASAKAVDAYHHGDLRAALITAAREALETMAPEAVTLKSLALRLGVSQPAPYRHFENREALLAAVAADGFKRFSEAQAAAAEGAPPAERFERSCLAYLAFGQANRGVYRLMFASRVMSDSDDEALDRASTAAFDALLQGVARFAPPERVYSTAVWIWSTLHGLVMLDAEGLTSGPIKAHASPADVVRQMVSVLASSPSPGGDKE
jgi:AcrR family transcriptional regulator